MEKIEPQCIIAVDQDTMITHSQGTAMVYQRKQYARGAIAVWRKTVTYDGHSFPSPRYQRRLLGSGNQ